MTIKAKICGLTSADAVQSAVEHGADYIGFVFFGPSVRYVTAQRAAQLAADVPGNIKTVAVVVGAGNEELDHIFTYFKPDYIQCHGEESEDRIHALHVRYALPVIKAVPVRTSDDVAKGKAYSNVADMLLFDAKVPTSALPGGNGVAFDWTLLKSRNFQVPWFLSGGINSENVVEALGITGAQMVDVSSSLESEPGVKDPDLIKRFLQKVKAI